ncbi:MAG: tRNA adenosine(34) deaminase TadA [Clostridiales Family XIII bacterium]|jgi:tRNA(adenine34) deaminase|nr:tRNA adenosine(34) deaminase TadA [Clostridiales Family XIII bacterium]
MVLLQELPRREDSAAEQERDACFFMREALREAAEAAAAGEIPIGAIVERDGRIIGRGRNRTEGEKDPTAHAEIEAIRQAAKALGGWRLTACRMYVTTEPCAMCAGALVLARVDKVYIGTPNAKGGACVSLYNLLRDDRLNHRVEAEVGVLRDECEHIMKEFFARLRSKKRARAEDDDQ